MNRALGIGLVVAGCLLGLFGLRSAESFSSDVSRFFTGSPTDKSVWLLLGGVACVAVGLALAMRREPRSA